jgi:hypothetical protein
MGASTRAKGRALHLFGRVCISNHTGRTWEKSKGGRDCARDGPESEDIPLDEMLDTVSSTCSLKPKGESQSVPSASALATNSSPRRATTCRKMTSSGDPGSGGVYFLFLIRLPGNAKGCFLSNGSCVGDNDLLFSSEFTISRRRAKPVSISHVMDPPGGRQSDDKRVGESCRTP